VEAHRDYFLHWRESVESEDTVSHGIDHFQAETKRFTSPTLKARINCIACGSLHGFTFSTGEKIEKVRIQFHMERITLKLRLYVLP